MRGSTLLLVGLLVTTVAVVLPFFARTRINRATNTCVNNLRQLDGAKQQWALCQNRTTNDLPAWDDLRVYLGLGPGSANRGAAVCPQGGTYTLGRIGEPPKCSLRGASHTLPP